MTDLTNKQLERLISASKSTNHLANAVGNDAEDYMEFFRRPISGNSTELWYFKPDASAGLVPPNYDDISGAIGTRIIQSRLHSLIQSSRNNPAACQSFVCVSSAPASHSIEDISAVRITQLIPPAFSPNKADASETDTNKRGFALTLYAALSGGGPGIALQPDMVSGPISITADPTDATGNNGISASYFVDYDSGIIRLSSPAVAGSQFNPHSIYGDINGLETTDGYDGALTLFVTAYRYSGSFQSDINLSQFCTIGDGVFSSGTFTGLGQDVFQSAINSLSNGGSIYVKDGYFSWDSDGYVTIPSNIKLIGTNRSFIRMREHTVGFRIQGSDVTIDNLQIECAGSQTPCSAIQISSNANGNTIQNVMVRDCQFTLDGDAYGISFNPDTNDITYQNIAILNNVFTNDSSYGWPSGSANPAFIGIIEANKEDDDNTSMNSMFKDIRIEDNIFDSVAGDAIHMVAEFATIDGLSVSRNRSNISTIQRIVFDFASESGVRIVDNDSSFYVSNQDWGICYYKDGYGTTGLGKINNGSGIFGVGRGSGFGVVGEGVSGVAGYGHQDGYGVVGFGYTGRPGVFGISKETFGIVGEGVSGVAGYGHQDGYGVVGFGYTDKSGIFGKGQGSGFGVIGEGLNGVVGYGHQDGYGVVGFGYTGRPGVFGTSKETFGVIGEGVSGVVGYGHQDGYGVVGFGYTGRPGVFGTSKETFGVVGEGVSGVVGYGHQDGYGVVGFGYTGRPGVFGLGRGTGCGVVGEGSSGVVGYGTGNTPVGGRFYSGEDKKYFYESFTTPGITEWICPPGVYSVFAECWGDGGGGGAVENATTTTGGGGGGGGFGAKTVTIIPGTVYAVKVGPGGPGGFGGLAQHSSFISDATVCGCGGSHGGTMYYGPAAGLGGTANVGDITYDGASGGAGDTDDTPGGGGGGGGGAGSSGNGSVGINGNGGGGTGGVGGTGGGGSGGAGGIKGTATSPTNGIQAGGGGGGAYWQAGPASGAAGAPGMVRLTYSISFEDSTFGSVGAIGFGGYPDGYGVIGIGGDCGILGYGSLVGHGVIGLAANGYAIFAKNTGSYKVPKTAPIHIEPQEKHPLSGSLGDLYVNSVTKKLYFFNGTTWVDLTI